MNKEFDQKLKEFESRQKRNNRNFKSIIVAGLLVFIGLYLYNIWTKKEGKAIQESIVNEQARTMEEPDSTKYQRIEYFEKTKRKDSIKNTLESFQQELLEIKSVARGNPEVIQRIDDLKDKINTMIAKTVDTVIVRYYKRKADGDIIENTIKQIDTPYYYIHHKEVYGDDGSKSVNTLYHGKNLKKSYVDYLFNTLRKNGAGITRKQPFISAPGFEWKENAIEIGFEKPTSTTNENAKLFIRVYSFKPQRGIKEKVLNKLEAKGYQVKLFSDWQKEKPSFFSDQSTVLYYNRANKAKADVIAKTLLKTTGIDFQTKMGGGYGVTDKEKKVLFIIHYNGAE
jgi:hypothetical protein